MRSIPHCFWRFRLLKFHGWNIVIHFRPLAWIIKSLRHGFSKWWDLILRNAVHRRWHVKFEIPLSNFSWNLENWEFGTFWNSFFISGKLLELLYRLTSFGINGMCLGLHWVGFHEWWLFLAPPIYTRPEECSCCLHEPPFPPWSCPQSLCNLIGIPLPSIVLLRPSSFPFWVLQLPPPVVRLIMPQTLRMLSVVFLSNL